MSESQQGTLEPDQDMLLEERDSRGKEGQPGGVEGHCWGWGREVPALGKMWVITTILM